jgi:hypothetical protein
MCVELEASIESVSVADPDMFLGLADPEPCIIKEK